MLTHIYRHSRVVDQSLPNTGPAVFCWDLEILSWTFPSLAATPSSFSFHWKRRQLRKLVPGSETPARSRRSTVGRPSKRFLESLEVVHRVCDCLNSEFETLLTLLLLPDSAEPCGGGSDLTTRAPAHTHIHTLWQIMSGLPP